MKYKRNLKKIEKTYKTKNFEDLKNLKEQYIYFFNKYKLFLIKNVKIDLVNKKLKKFENGVFYRKEIKIGTTEKT